MKNLSTATATKYAILYCRVSDQSQVDKWHSINMQEPMLREFATQSWYIVKKVFTDKGKTATTTVWREELYNAFDYIKQQKNISAFIVQDTDRMSRNEEDHFWIRGFFKKHKVTLISKNQPWINNTAEWQLMDTMMAWVNAFQSRLTWRKVSWVMQRLVDQGKTPGQAPIWYLNVNIWTSEKPERTVEVDEVCSKHIEDIFRLYATSKHSLIDIANILNEKWARTQKGTKFQRSMINKILVNPYYIWKIKYKGKVYDWKHPRLISDELFQKCKDTIATRNKFAIRKRKPENHRTFFLKWFLKCGICWNNLWWYTAKGHNYYTCTVKSTDKRFHSNKWQCSKIWDIETQIEDHFNQLELSDDIVDEVLARAKEILKETHGEVDTEKHSITIKVAKLESRRQSLETKLLDWVINDDVYTRNHKLIDEELLWIKSRESEISQTREDNTKLFESLVRLARNLPLAYGKASVEVKKMYLGIFFESFTVKDTLITKTIPSKVVCALMNDKLITLRKTSKDWKVLIKKLWGARWGSNPRHPGPQPSALPLSYGLHKSRRY